MIITEMKRGKRTHRLELVEEFHAVERRHGVRHENKQDNNGTQRLDHTDRGTVHRCHRPPTVSVWSAILRGDDDGDRRARCGHSLDDVKRQILRACARQSTAWRRARLYV